MSGEEGEMIRRQAAERIGARILNEWNRTQPEATWTHSAGVDLVRRIADALCNVTVRVDQEIAMECAERDAARARLAVLERALDKINAIRNSIVGMQGFNFSEHAYPLVAALNEAGFVGQPYPEARANLGTLIEQRDRAEARAGKAEAEATHLYSCEHCLPGDPCERYRDLAARKA